MNTDNYLAITIFFLPMISLIAMIAWLKYTEWHIDREHKQRQDDE